MENKFQIFICYAREDADRVKEFYRRLKDAGLHPWLDDEDMVAGMSWELTIKRELKRSNFVLVCLSATSINKRGFLNKEINEALEHAKEKLEDDIWLIPARLDECEVPNSLSKIQWVDLFNKDGWVRLLKALELQLKRQVETLPASQPKLPLPQQLELEEQRHRAEAARLSAEQQLLKQEFAELQYREQEMIAQQSLIFLLLLAQARTRYREQELAELQRKSDDEGRRKEEVFRSRRLLISAAMAIAIITLIAYLLLNVNCPPVAVMLVRQEFISDGRVKFHFTASEEGYLHLIAKDGDDVKKSLTVLLHGQLLRSSVDFEFPGGDKGIELGTNPEEIILVFSSVPDKELKVAWHRLETESDRRYLQLLRLASDKWRTPEKLVNGSVMTISARPVLDTPLVTEVTIPGKAKPIG